MKIAFWSIANEKCSVSANMAAISVTSVIRYPYSVIALENQRSGNNLGMAFLGRSHVDLLNEVGTNYYDGGGIEGLIRKIYRGDYHVGVLKTYTEEVISKHLFYIPQSRVIHSEIFDYEFNHCILPLLKILEEQVDICFIDTASHQNLSTKTILEEAELIVVNLCQDPMLLEEFFLNYSSMISKAIFLLSNYDSRNKLHYKKISARYDIPLESISVIPKNEMFQNACFNGSVVEFISRNYSCLKENPNYFFIQAIKKATCMIVKKTVELSKQKENGVCYR